MNHKSAVDVPRLIAISTLSFCVLAGSLVYFAFEPRVAQLQSALDDAQATLRSDDVAFAEMPHVRYERNTLARQYDRLLTDNPEAVFLRDLDATTRRHGIRLVSTSIAHDAATRARAPGARSLLVAVEVRLVLAGTYSRLLAAIGDLSQGSEIVRVDAPSLQRSDGAVSATVPVTIFEPLGAE